MMKFGNLLIAGITTGAIYAMFAVCVSVWYRVSNILNLAVGDFAMVGALGVDNLYRVKGLPLPVAIITTLVVVAVFANRRVELFGRDAPALQHALVHRARIDVIENRPVGRGASRGGNGTLPGRRTATARRQGHRAATGAIHRPSEGAAAEDRRCGRRYGFDRRARI